LDTPLAHEAFPGPMGARPSAEKARAGRPEEAGQAGQAVSIPAAVPSSTAAPAGQAAQVAEAGQAAVLDEVPVQQPAACPADPASVAGGEEAEAEDGSAEQALEETAATVPAAATPIAALLASEAPVPTPGPRPAEAGRRRPGALAEQFLAQEPEEQPVAAWSWPPSARAAQELEPLQPGTWSWPQTPQSPLPSYGPLELGPGVWPRRAWWEQANLAAAAMWGQTALMQAAEEARRAEEGRRCWAKAVEETARAEERQRRRAKAEAVLARQHAWAAAMQRHLLASETTAKPAAAEAEATSEADCVKADEGSLRQSLPDDAHQPQAPTAAEAAGDSADGGPAAVEAAGRPRRRRGKVSTYSSTSPAASGLGAPPDVQEAQHADGRSSTGKKARGTYRSVARAAALGGS